MPLTRFVADVVGLLTICLVALLILLGLISIFYLIYLRYRIKSQGFTQLKFFSSPWIIRIIFIMFSIWWGLGEIIRLDLLRQKGRLLSSVSFKWQETVCKCYIISNMGFAEPYLYLTLAILLRTPLQSMESGPLRRRWNAKALRNVLLWVIPIILLQAVVILAGPKLSIYKDGGKLLPDHFTRSITVFALEGQGTVALCTFPLLSTIVFGVFTTILAIYLTWIGKKNLNLVINKVLERRIFIVVSLAVVCLPLRYILLGLTALLEPEAYPFQALAFMAFLASLCCIAACIFILVYCPAADSLALGSLQDLEARRRVYENLNVRLSLIASQSNLEESSRNSPTPSRVSGASTKTESISFRADDRSGTFVELSLFSPGRDESYSQFQGWPMRPPIQAQSAAAPSSGMTS